MPNLRTTTDARWDCHGCGDCCRGYELGPVEPDIIQALVERDVAAAWAPAAGAPWFTTRTGPEGREGLFLAYRDGTCVFLRPDNLCAIHGLYGADAKPGFCREYPFHVLDDPAGTAVVVRASCSSLHRAVDGGTPVADQAATVDALPRAYPRRRFAPETVPILPDVGLPLADWMAHEGRLLALLDDPTPEPESAVARIRAVLFTLAQRPLGEVDARRARLATGAVVEALRRLMGRAAADPDPRAEAHRVAFAQTAHALLERAQAHHGSPRPLTDDGRRYLLGLLRSFLIAKSWASVGSVADGLGAFLVQTAVVRTAAPGDGPIDANAASQVIIPWTRMIENPAITGVFRLARPALWDAFVFDAG
jgi:Fe-S-cluster containining protein